MRFSGETLFVAVQFVSVTRVCVCVSVCLSVMADIQFDADLSIRQPIKSLIVLV